MKRSKNQALYRYLPGMWVSDGSESGIALSSKVLSWNYRNMEGIYQNYIEGEIKRQLKLFEKKGGDINLYDLINKNVFCIVEPNCSDDKTIPDISGTVSPLFFYCSSCGHSFMAKNIKEVMSGSKHCPICKTGSIKQLQMIYSCQCGYAEPIRLPYVDSHSMIRWKYNPNHEQFKINYIGSNGIESTKEFLIQCKNCGNVLRPSNATDGRNFKPFSVKMINLVSANSGKFFDKGIDAHKTIAARWFCKLSETEYEKLVNDSDYAFDPRHSIEEIKKEAEKEARMVINLPGVPESNYKIIYESILETKLSNSSGFSVDECGLSCDEIFAEKKKKGESEYNSWLEGYAFRLMQYFTVKDSRKKITLDDSVARQLELELIDSKEQVFSMNEKLGIKSAHATCDSQIITCVYGYTRKTENPMNNNNANCPRLKMNSFGKDKRSGRTLIYGAILNTEGLLIELDQKKIIQWLLANKIISEVQMPDIEDELSVKKWFALNVHSDAISQFADIEGDAITAAVYSLLHSMSHAFISAAGEISGLSGNSISEILFVDTASIFIYAQTSQGVPLGAMSGMFECRYYQLLKNVYKDSKHCVFDPICERHQSACAGCLIISDTSCSSFNKMLGRKYLYSLRDVEDIKKGFWEM